MTVSWNFDCRDGNFLDKLAIQSDYWTTKFVKELISDDKRTAANNLASSEHGIGLPENRNRIRSSKGQSQKLLQSKWIGWICKKAPPSQRRKANGSSLRRQCMPTMWQAIRKEIYRTKTDLLF